MFAIDTTRDRVEERREAVRQLVGSIRNLPLLSGSFALYWMQTILLFQSPYLLLGPSPFLGLGLPKGTALLIASVTTYSVWASLYKKLNAVSGARWFWPALCLMLVVGAALYCFYPAAPEPLRIPAYLLGSVFIGCGMANICMETGRVYGYIGPRNVLFHGIVALTLGTLCAYLLSLTPHSVGCAVLVLTPFPMVVCLQRTMAKLPAKTVYMQGMDTMVQIPGKFLATSAFQGLALGVMNRLLIDGVGGSAAIVSLGFLGATVLLFLCAITTKNNFDTLIYRIGFPLMACGLFAVGMFGGRAVAGTLLLDAGYGFQYLMTCSLLAFLAKGFGQPPVWTVGLGTACLLGGQFVGSVLVSVSTDRNAMAVFVAFVLVLAALFMTSGKNMQLGWGAVRPGSGVLTAAARLSPSIVTACKVVASQCGLSSREADVLVQTMRGFSRRAIAQELCLAEETVKTHLGRIYQKTQVHSRQELIEYVTRQESSLE